MRVVLVALGAGVVALVGWMLLDLRAATHAPETTLAAPAAPPTTPAVAPPGGTAMPPPLARPLPIRSPVATAPGEHSLGEAPAAPNPEEAAPATNPMDAVKMGKTVREWRHFYGERQRAIQEDMYKNEELLDRADTADPPTAAEISDAHARNEDLRRRMREDILELRKIEASP